MSAMQGRRVAVTGVGPITPIGIGKRAFWDAALEGRSGSRSLEYEWFRDDEYTTRVGAPVRGFEPTEYGIPRKDIRILDPATCYAIAGGRMALDDAGIAVVPVDDSRARGLYRLEGPDPERVAVILGSGIGGLHSMEESHRHWTVKKTRRGAKRYCLPMLIPNALPAQTAIRLGARGECKVIGTACAAGTMAIGDAYRLVRDGEADMAVTGGVDGVLSDLDGYGLMGFDMLKTVSTWEGDPTEASRPFDRDRMGFVLGEGAGVLVIEEMEQALARGATIYAEIRGYRASCDAHSMMQLAADGEQIARMMRDVLEAGGLAPADVDYVNAHGTGTLLNDPTETRAIRKAFGSAAADLAISATKSMTGHGIGASGGIEAIATVLAVHAGRVHPTINLENPDPECDLDYVPLEAREMPVRAALSNSYGFGGHNGSLLFAAP